MKFREHRGGFAESMDTVVELPDRAALARHVNRLLSSFGNYDVGPEDLVVTQYVPGNSRDHRNGWEDVHIVTLADYGVLGFTDRAC